MRYESVYDATVNEPFSIPIRASQGEELAWMEKITRKLAPGAQVTAKYGNLYLNAEQYCDNLISLSGSAVKIPYRGYASPFNNSPFLADHMDVPMMFGMAGQPYTPEQARSLVDQIKNTPDNDAAAEIIRKATCPSNFTSYLRPETAQGIFVNLPQLLQASYGLRLPFGVAQVGKSFRNEIRPEYGNFRTQESEQAELENFVAPDDAEQVFKELSKERLAWWQSYAHPTNGTSAFHIRPHEKDELAHYAVACNDIEYAFPWGMGEVEGIANRGSYDLQCHAPAMHGGIVIVRDEKTNLPVVPHVIENSMGVGRAMLAYLHHAMTIVKKGDKSRFVLRLDRSVAPFKVAVIPLVPVPEINTVAHQVTERLRNAGYDAPN